MHLKSMSGIYSVAIPVVFVVGLYMADLLVGLPMFGIIASVSVVIYFFYLLFYYLSRKQLPRTKMALLHTILGVLLAIGSVSSNVINRSFSETGSRVIVEALCKYRTDNGIFPQSLDDLVPKYLNKIPRSKLISFVGRDFVYRATFGEHVLSWVHNTRGQNHSMEVDGCLRKSEKE